MVMALPARMDPRRLQSLPRQERPSAPKILQNDRHRIHELRTREGELQNSLQHHGKERHSRLFNLPAEMVGEIHLLQESVELERCG